MYILYKYPALKMSDQYIFFVFVLMLSFIIYYDNININDITSHKKEKKMISSRRLYKVFFPFVLIFFCIVIYFNFCKYSLVIALIIIYRISNDSVRYIRTFLLYFFQCTTTTIIVSSC